MPFLSSADIRRYRDTGYVVVSGFLDEAELTAIEAAHDAAWRDLPDDVVVDSELTGRRMYIKDVTDEERNASLKVNDLYLQNADVREVVLSERLGAALRELMQQDPVVCNTLSVDYGTQQADHLDTLFMTPQTPGHLIATWIALEDVEAGAGPLRYYPESNHIEPYRFVDGGYHVRQDEMDRWGDYMADAVDRHGLEEVTFLAKRGDLLIWDAWLLHGGCEIQTAGRTRKSLITHYYSRSDCRALGSRLGVTSGGHWLDRAPQPVPAGPSAAVAAAPPEPRPAAGLRERMDQLDPSHH